MIGTADILDVPYEETWNFGVNRIDVSKFQERIASSLENHPALAMTIIKGA